MYFKYYIEFWSYKLIVDWKVLNIVFFFFVVLVKVLYIDRFKYIEFIVGGVDDDFRELRMLV